MTETEGKGSFLMRLLSLNESAVLIKQNQVGDFVCLSEGICE